MTNANHRVPLSQQEGVIIPPMLYLPVRIGPEGQQLAEVRETADGRRALLAYTALDRLADQCGFEQPWVLVKIEDLGDIKDEQPFDIVSFDPVISDRLKSEGKLA